MKYVITAVHDLGHWPNEQWDRTFAGNDVTQIIEQHIRAEDDEDGPCSFSYWFDGLDLLVITNTESLVTNSFDSHKWWTEGFKQGKYQKGKEIIIYPDIKIEDFINWLNIK